MEITIKWFDGQYPSFNVSVASDPSRDPFIEVKGCRICKGKDGEFVAPPSTKGKNDKYWNHAYFSKDFAAVVFEKAKELQPKPKQEVETYSNGLRSVSTGDGFDSDCHF